MNEDMENELKLQCRKSFVRVVELGATPEIADLIGLEKTQKN